MLHRARYADYFQALYLQPSRPEDYREEDEGLNNGERKTEEADEGCAEKGHLRTCLVESAEHRGPDEQGGRNDGEDQPVGENVNAAEEFVEAVVLELHLELTVGDLGQQQPDLLGIVLDVAGVLQRALLGHLGQDLWPVASGEESLCVRPGYLVDVDGRVYGAGEPLGGHEGLGKQGKNGRHPEPVAAREGYEL